MAVVGKEIAVRPEPKSLRSVQEAESFPANDDPRCSLAVYWDSIKDSQEPISLLTPDLASEPAELSFEAFGSCNFAGDIELPEQSREEDCHLEKFPSWCTSLEATSLQASESTWPLSNPSSSLEESSSVTHVALPDVKMEMDRAESFWEHDPKFPDSPKMAGTLKMCSLESSAHCYGQEAASEGLPFLETFNNLQDLEGGKTSKARSSGSWSFTSTLPFSGILGQGEPAGFSSAVDVRDGDMCKQTREELGSHRWQEGEGTHDICSDVVNILQEGTLKMQELKVEPAVVDEASEAGLGDPTLKWISAPDLPPSPSEAHQSFMHLQCDKSSEAETIMFKKEASWQQDSALCDWRASSGVADARIDGSSVCGKRSSCGRTKPTSSSATTPSGMFHQELMEGLEMTFDPVASPMIMPLDLEQPDPLNALELHSSRLDPSFVTAHVADFTNDMLAEAPSSLLASNCDWGLSLPSASVHPVPSTAASYQSFQAQGSASCSKDGPLHPALSLKEELQQPLVSVKSEGTKVEPMKRWETGLKGPSAAMSSRQGVAPALASCQVLNLAVPSSQLHTGPGSLAMSSLPANLLLPQSMLAAPQMVTDGRLGGALQLVASGEGPQPFGALPPMHPVVRQVRARPRRALPSRVCVVEGCCNGARGQAGLCIGHGGGRRCQFLACTKGAEGRTGFCKGHGGGKRCAKEGCPKSAEGKTAFCIAHGGGRRCTAEGCQKAARAGSTKCIRHGGGRRCSVENCKSSAEGLTGLCVAHGGGRRCQFPGCHKSAQGGTSRCKAHGGGRRCSILACTTAAEGKGDPPLCKAHGGGKRCVFGGGGVCTKSVHGGTQFCVAHGGGKRCKSQGCDKSARGRTAFCVRHGGGRRCKEPGCGKSAQGSTDLCKGHGGGKRCMWIMDGQSTTCGKFARSKTSLCPSHGALVADSQVRNGDLFQVLQGGAPSLGLAPPGTLLSNMSMASLYSPTSSGYFGGLSAAIGADTQFDTGGAALVGQLQNMNGTPTHSVMATASFGASLPGASQGSCSSTSSVPIGSSTSSQTASGAQLASTYQTMQLFHLPPAQPVGNANNNSANSATRFSSQHSTAGSYSTVPNSSAWGQLQASSESLPQSALAGAPYLLKAGEGTVQFSGMTGSSMGAVQFGLLPSGTLCASQTMLCGPHMATAPYVPSQTATGWKACSVPLTSGQGPPASWQPVESSAPDGMSNIPPMLLVPNSMQENAKAAASRNVRACPDSVRAASGACTEGRVHGGARGLVGAVLGVSANKSVS